jgi:hypothetical protein
MAPRTPAETIAHTPVASSMSLPDAAPLTANDPHERALPFGRSLVVRASAQGGEAVEIRDAQGALEVEIALTADGPLVRVRGGRLEATSQDIAFRCRTLDVQATESIRLASDGGLALLADEVRVKTEQDIHLNGAFVRLNCTEDAVSQAAAATAAMASAVAAVLAPEAHADHDHEPPHGER